jgi:hypothetical protein
LQPSPLVRVFRQIHRQHTWLWLIKIGKDHIEIVRTFIQAESVVHANLTPREQCDIAYTSKSRSDARASLSDSHVVGISTPLNKPTFLDILSEEVSTQEILQLDDDLRVLLLTNSLLGTSPNETVQVVGKRDRHRLYWPSFPDSSPWLLLGWRL